MKIRYIPSEKIISLHNCNPRKLVKKYAKQDEIIGYIISTLENTELKLKYKSEIQKKSSI